MIKKHYKMKTEPHLCYLSTAEDLLEVTGLIGEVKSLDFGIAVYSSDVNPLAIVVFDLHCGVVMASFKISEDVLLHTNTNKDAVDLMADCIDTLSERITKTDVLKIKATQKTIDAIKQPEKITDYRARLI